MANKPNIEVRRNRKRRAAYVYRRRCAYCRVAFRSLDEATLDHIVPRSVWHTWTATALALACGDCNQAKANRFPLSIALLLAARYPVHGEPCVFTAGVSTVHDAGPVFTAEPGVLTDQGDVFTGEASTVHGEPAVPPLNGSTVHGESVVFTGRTRVPGPVFTLGVWRLLARLAHAHQVANPPTPTYDRYPPRRISDRPESALEQQHRSTPDLRDEARHTPRHTRSGLCPTGQCDHHCPRRSVGADVGSTGAAVCA
ncbi:HNH endonuclease [Streptomyces sp. LE64]|uniref:HNH endonuclease n=1 Tax=Streptomyces sp. LE64 TaxID=3448653 RepID=UPI004042C8D1